MTARAKQASIAAAALLDHIKLLVEIDRAEDAHEYLQVLETMIDEIIRSNQ